MPDMDNETKMAFRCLAVSSDKVAKNYLCLPSTNYGDVIHGVNTGALDPKTTKLWIIESSTKRFKKVQAKARELGFKFRAFNCEAHQVNLRKHLKGEKIDHAFLDFCGEVTAPLLYWLHSLGQDGVFAEDCSLSFTYSIVGRRNPLLNTWVSFSFDGDFYNIESRLQRKMQHSNINVPYNETVRNKFLATLKLTVAALIGDYRLSIDKAYTYHSDGAKTPMAIIRLKLGKKKVLTSSLTGLLLRKVKEWGFGSYDDYRKALAPARKKRNVTDKKRPKGMSPQQWAWSWDNPSSIRNRKMQTA